MNMIKHNTAGIVYLALLLCLCTLLVACTGNDLPEQGSESATGQTTAADTESTDSSESVTDAPTQETTDATTEQVTEPAPQTVTYTVSVTGSDGNPRQGAVIRFYKGEEQLIMVPTDAEGVAATELLPDTYTFAVDNILGEQYDSTNCTLSPEQPSAEVRLYGLPAQGEEIYAYSPLADDYVAYRAGKIGQGEYYVTLEAGDMTYLLFVASQGGMFRISADAQLDLSIGYFGSTSFVLTESAVAEQDNAIELEVYDDMVYNYAFVIGLGTEDASLIACTLRVEYVGEREISPEEMPWNDLMPTGTLTKFTKPSGKLTAFDVTDMQMSAVYNPEDGYYHVGSADGPVLMLSIDQNSPYMDALTAVCNNMRLGVYVYDENGSFVRKDSYNELIWAYNEVADGGYYPLDQTLADMMVAVGDYMGWYSASSPLYLFEGKALVPGNAYLFACVYVQ